MATTTSVSLYGRTKIETAYDYIDIDNVVEIVNDAIEIHDENVTQIEELLNYYRGKQAIRNREKHYRTDVMNIITENRAKEIVDFKVGYLSRGPIQYISRGLDSTGLINTLNDYMLSEEKASKDKRLLTWMMIAGTGYRMICADSEFELGDDSSPFEIYTLDPRKAFVIYSSGITEEALAGVYEVVDSDDVTHYTVYTNDKVYKFTSDDQNPVVSVNGYGRIPIIEYPANESRIGSFEPVIPILDAINDLDSNRLDGVEQFVQSIVVATNCEFGEDETSSTLAESGLVSLRSFEGMEQKIQILTQELNQSQTQVLKDDLIQTYKEICCMPNRNGGSSTSDTGLAVIYRDGWSDAEADAVGIETLFIESERQALKIILTICKELGSLLLDSSKVDVSFTRRNYENIETKSQVLINMLNSKMIAPKYCFEYSNMFRDPEQVCKDSMEYYAENFKDTSSTPLVDTEIVAE